MGGKCQNPAGTYLNLCALLSQMGKHQEALQHADRAVKLLEAAPPQESTGGSSESLICVAYFNMGAGFEHLKKVSEAQWAYQRAYENCLTELGAEHPLSQQISLCLTQLKAKKS